MEEPMVKDYYTSRKSAFLKDYDEKTGEIFKGLLAAYYGGELANTMVREIRQEFEALIPKLPYIGGDKNMQTGELLLVIPFLALYKVLKARGKTVQEIGKIIYLSYEIYFDRFPPYHMMFADMPRDVLKGFDEMAVESQKRRYPGDWVFTAVESEEFDMAFDELECGMCKFFDAQGAMEIMPYICLADFVMSRACGTGLTRTTTLAEGADKCDFRFKFGRQATQGWPPGFLKPEDLKKKPREE
jgi:hypothetical protein